MDNIVVIVVAILAIVAIVAVVLWTTQRRRSDELQRRFGPEYERTLEATRDKRQAEADLRARQERVDALEIRPLERTARDGYVDRWREVQAMFVDDPGNAVDQADKLIGDVMRARDYPVGDFEQRAADISVNHPQVVDHYRTAHAIAVKRRSGEGATEQLRQAFVHYRALFADLLETADADAADAAGAAAAPAAAPPDAAGAKRREAAPPTPAAPAQTETPTDQRSAGQEEPVAARPMQPAAAGAPEGTTVSSTETPTTTPEPVDPARSA